MKTFTFTLVLDGISADTPNYEDLLFEAGCDDGLICTQGKSIYINFDREADSAVNAITSAIKDVEKAGATVFSIPEGTYASLASMADMADITRASMAALASGKRGDNTFPPASVPSSRPLWYWPLAAEWLHKHGKITDEVMEVAQAARNFAHDLDQKQTHAM